MENNSNAEKLFSAQEVINLTASLIGSKPKDLIEKIEDNDLTTFDNLSGFLKPFTVKRLNQLREESVNKGFRQASKKTERLWQEVFQEDIQGKKLEDLFMEHKTQISSQSSKADKSKAITIQQALNSPEVSEYIKKLQVKADTVDNITTQFESYKTLQNIKADALNELTERGAKFSDNPKIKRLQLMALEDELSKIKFKRDNNGSIVVLDEDGESPLYNKETATHWNFGEYVANLSPVDFVEKTQPKQNRNTFVPSTKSGNNSASFGYSNSQIKNFTYEDFNRVNKEGRTEEAKFIQEQMILNYENTK